MSNSTGAGSKGAPRPSPAPAMGEKANSRGTRTVSLPEAAVVLLDGSPEATGGRSIALAGVLLGVRVVAGVGGGAGLVLEAGAAAPWLLEDTLALASVVVAAGSARAGTDAATARATSRRP